MSHYCIILQITYWVIKLLYADKSCHQSQLDCYHAVIKVAGSDANQTPLGSVGVILPRSVKISVEAWQERIVFLPLRNRHI